MKSPQDEKLIKDLYEKLNWFTFQAEGEEFDEKQVRAILQLLDTLDPIDFEGAEKECMQKKRNASEPKRRFYRVGKPDSFQNEAPADDADAAFERFKKKYAIREADLQKKDRAKIIPFAGSEEASEELVPDLDRILLTAAAESSAESSTSNRKMDAESVRNRQKRRRRGRRLWKTAGGRAAIAFLSIAAALAVTGICTSAVRQKSFFEVVRDGVNSMKITVTGNEMESQTGLEMESSQKVYYQSWDEIKEENPEVVVPGYIPEGLELVELYGKEFGNYIRYNGVYKDERGEELVIHERYYKGNYAENEIGNEAKYIEEENGILYYLEGSSYKGFGKSEKCSYTVYWKELNQLKKIMREIK